VCEFLESSAKLLERENTTIVLPSKTRQSSVFPLGQPLKLSVAKEHVEPSMQH